MPRSTLFSSARALIPAVAWLLGAVLVLVTALVVAAAPASAHNSFSSSDPPDGAVLDAAPPSVLLRYANDVPLDTVQVLWIDQSGSRRELGPLTHGPAGPTEVVAPVPPDAQGPVTVRWRLVGADGHVVSGRVALTLPALEPAAGAPAPSDSTPAAPAATPATAAAVEEVPAEVASSFRWVLRLASFASMVLLGGVVLVAGALWPAGWEHRSLRRFGVGAGIVLVVSSFLLLLVLASDLEGTGLTGALGAIDAAAATEAGTALAVRVALAAVTLWVLVAWHPAGEQSRWAVLGGLVVAGLATWAVNGHARSMRWPWLGVPLDVVHYAAAAAWLGGLAVLAVVAFREASIQELVPAVRRFSTVAAVSVVIIVATGAVQAVRLVGGISGLVDSDHGRILLAKLLVLGGMLAIADRNRRRVRERFRSADAASPAVRGGLRRAMTAEAGLGAAVLAITAALVVTAPGVSEPAPTADVTSEVTTPAP